jgi:ankyrin repeat protein
MEIEVLLELIGLILTQKDEAGAFRDTISKGKFCLPYFDYLLSEGFLPDEEDLLSCTKLRQIELVRFVLKSGIKPTLESFQYAAEHDFFELCHLFVEFGSREILSTQGLEEQLIVACISEHSASAKRLINLGTDPTCWNNYAFRKSSLMGNTVIVSLLLKHGIDPTVEDNYAIRYASQFGHTDVVRLLLKHGADPTVKNNRAIQWASEKGHLEVVRLLLNNNSKYKVDPKANDNFAIKHASGPNKDAIITLLEEHGASL